MKVIFLEDIPRVAKAGDIKEVANGYGRNFLIPKKLALPAKPGATTMMEAKLEIEKRAQAKAESQLVELAKQLEGKEVILKAKVGAKDKLYGSITTADIAAGLESTAGLVVDKRKIDLAEPIRGLGSYDVTVKLNKDLMPKIKVTVIEEEPEANAE